MTARLLAVALVGVLLFPLAAALPLPDPTVSGQHFNLNLLAKEKRKQQTQDGGGKIFVPLHGQCRIDLHEADAFRVEDSNCTDGTAAAFALPDPDPADTGTSTYRVYVRALAKPGGDTQFTTCREDKDGTYCSSETITTARAAGASPYQDGTQSLLTLCYDSDGDGDREREQIFDDDNSGYFWKYDNNGLRLAQLRFYPETPTAINGACA